MRQRRVESLSINVPVLHSIICLIVLIRKQKTSRETALNRQPTRTNEQIQSSQ